MKILITYFFIAISFFGLGQSKELMTKPELLVVDTNIVFKHFTDIQVFQFFGVDSLNGEVTHSIKLNSNGDVMAEYHKNYMTDAGNGLIDALKINEYNNKNQLIISNLYYDEAQENREVQKSFYYYRDTLLIRVESFSFRRKLRADVDKGIGRSGGCIVTSDDYEKERTWTLRDIVLYKYDKKGRKKLNYSLVSQRSPNRFEYIYDENDNLIREKAMDKSKFHYIVNYRYIDNKIISNLQWSYGVTKRIKTYNNGNLVKESVIQKDKKWIDEYKYDSDGKLVRFIAYNSNGEIGLTHVYRYKKTGKEPFYR